MKRFLVVVKDDFVNAEIADNNYVEDFYGTDFQPGSYSWDYASGEFVVGVYEGKNEVEAIKRAADDYEINEKALKTYELI